MYQSMLGISWGLGYVVGALVGEYYMLVYQCWHVMTNRSWIKGGVAAENTGWRSVFWMAVSVIALNRRSLY